MSKLDMGSFIHIKNQWNILVIGNYHVNYQNLMLLTSSETKRTLMHLLLFTNSAQRELVSICTQSIHDRNWLSLPYILAFTKGAEVRKLYVNQHTRTSKHFCSTQFMKISYNWKHLHFKSYEQFTLVWYARFISL